MNLSVKKASSPLPFPPKEEREQIQESASFVQGNFLCRLSVW
jgi:hypothetical protein